MGSYITLRKGQQPERIPAIDKGTRKFIWWLHLRANGWKWDIGGSITGLDRQEIWDSLADFGTIVDIRTARDHAHSYMKKRFLGLIYLLLSLPLLNFSQEVPFFEGTFEDAQKLAKEQQYFLMLEFYEPGCEVCDFMSTDVFTYPPVATLFTDRYVSYRVDAINTQPDMVKQFSAHAFPTFLFFDAQGKQVVRYEGGMSGDAFLRFSEGVLNFSENQRRIAENPYDGEALAGFLAVLRATDAETAQLMATDYLEFVDELNYSEPHNFFIISEFVRDYQSKEFGYIFSHQGEFQPFPDLVTFLNACLGTLWREAIDEKDPGKKDLYMDMAISVMQAQDLWNGKSEEAYRAEIEAAFEAQTNPQK